jgi:polyhydroxyalkanoate synthesis regulator phasin
MPVNTRAQVKNSENSHQLTSDFILNIRKLVEDTVRAKGEDNKMRVALEFYKLINKDLNKFVQSTSINKLINFIRTVYYKTIQFETDYNLGRWNKIDKKLLHNYVIEFTKTKKYLIRLIKIYHGDNWQLKAETENDIYRAEIGLLRAKQEKMRALEEQMRALEEQMRALEEQIK